MKKNKSYDIREIFEQMELDLISNMHKTFHFHQKEEAKEGFKWEQWQKSKLRAIETYRKKNKNIIGAYNKSIQNTIDKELKSNYRQGERVFKFLINKVKKFLGFKHKEGIINIPEDTAEKMRVRDYINAMLGRKVIAPPDEEFFGVNEKKLKTLQEAVQKDIKKAQASILRKMNDVYKQTIYKSQMYMQSGAVSLNKAIDMATKDFLSKGIDSIKYKDGKCVNIASYAEMCLRTANHRAKLLGEGSKRDEWGIHLVVVSAHANTCEMCEPWQGQILIDDVFSHPSKEYIKEHSKKYKLLSEAIKAGLMHPNCRHNLTTYFEGITVLPQIQNGKEAVKTYEAEQKQRAYERAIRKQKRIVEGTQDEITKQNEKIKLKALERKLRKHLEIHKELKRNYYREKVKV